MIEITTEQDLKQFFRQTHAILFFHASWSQYAVISRQMVEFVERYATGKRDVSFFFGEFEGKRLPLAETLVAAGVPGDIAFSGNGSLSFFQHGKHLRTMHSVIGEGNWTVWRNIDELFGKKAV